MSINPFSGVSVYRLETKVFETSANKLILYNGVQSVVHTVNDGVQISSQEWLQAQEYCFSHWLWSGVSWVSLLADFPLPCFIDLQGENGTSVPPASAMPVFLHWFTWGRSYTWVVSF